MIILRHNNLSTDDLFIIERILLKVSETTYRKDSLDYTLLNKPRAEVYGFIAGIFQRMNICQTLGITTSDFLDFLIDIEKGYNDNPYHSFYHAVDVAMVLYHMIEQYDMGEYLTMVDIAMIMIAALCHDIGHPGKNNHFEVSCKTEKAKLYKNLSVLESHSCSLALELLDKHQLLRNLESQTSLLGIAISKENFKKSIVKMILATDMVCHFTLKDNIQILHEKIDELKQHSQVKKVLLSMGNKSEKRKLKPLFPQQNPFDYFQQHFFCHAAATTTTTTTTQPEPLELITTNHCHLLNQKERLMLCKILIHAADISNPCRPWTVFHQQSRLVCVEFFRQGDIEESMGLPISPNMNRKEANPSSINVGFIDYIVQPYFEALSLLFPKSKELLVHCAKNRGEWLKLSTENIDIFGNKLLPIEVAMGGSIKQVTIAAGTVEIPGKFEKVIRNKLRRSQSYNPSWILSTDDHLRIRRKSEEISLLYQRTKSPIGRRKSDASTYMSQPKMVSFSDYK